MKFYVRTLSLALLAAAAVFSINAQDGPESSSKVRQNDFCSSEGYKNGKHVTVRELREITVPSTGSVNIDARKNGGITVVGDERSDVLVRACVEAWAASDADAKALLGRVSIDTGGTIRSNAGTAIDDAAVSYQVFVPRRSDLSLTATNGGIQLKNVEGKIEFTTRNGGVNLYEIAGSVKGSTTNGGIFVTLSGSSWSGAGMDLQTTNGGVNVRIPENYSANLEAGTVNGGFRSNLPAVIVTTEDLRGAERGSHLRSVNTALNGGGAPIRIVTTNGGVNVSALKM